MPTGIFKRKPHTEETKKKISGANKGKKHPNRKKPFPRSEEHRRKLSLVMIGNQYSRGIKRTEETKRKMSLAKKGQKPYEMTEEIRQNMSKSQKGSTPWNKNKKDCYSEKTLASMRESHRKFIGEKSPNWKNNKMADYPENERIRKSLEYKLWRKSVFVRDNFTCQKCKIIGGELRAHHINNFADFPELRLAIDNGIVLCKDCHEEFHRKYGRNNNTKEQVGEFKKNERSEEDQLFQL